MQRSFIVLLLFVLCILFATAQTTRFIEHRVRWMENIHTISKKYKIDPKVVLDYNRISANEIRRGIIIRIPVDPLPGSVANRFDTIQGIAPPSHSFDPRSDCFEFHPSPLTEYRVSLILPFLLSQNQQDTQFLDFYEGFLLALLDLKAEGMSVIVTIYDSEAINRFSSFVQSGSLLQENLVIGPVYANDLFEMVHYTYGQNVKIISPLDQQTEPAAYTNPNFFQVNSSLYWQQSNLVPYLTQNSGIVWLFYEGEGNDEELVGMTREILRDNHIVYQEFAHKVEKNKDIVNELSLRLSQYQNNQVIVASSNEPFVADILRNLSLVQSRFNYPITLYGNAKWRSFGVDLEYYHNMNLHLSVPNYIDYHRSDVKHFLGRYRALFRSEPSPLAYQGYDIGIYFLRALYSRGPHFDFCIEHGVVPAQPLQSNFRFQKVSPDGGFINTDSHVIRYLPDFSIVTLH